MLPEQFDWTDANLWRVQNHTKHIFDSFYRGDSDGNDPRFNLLQLAYCIYGQESELRNCTFLPATKWSRILCLLLLDTMVSYNGVKSLWNHQYQENWKFKKIKASRIRRRQKILSKSSGQFAIFVKEAAFRQILANIAMQNVQFCKNV